MADGQETCKSGRLRAGIGGKCNSGKTWREVTAIA